MKKIYHVNTDQNKCGLEILISDEVDFREKILLEKRDNYVTIKWSTHKEDVTKLNEYVPKARASRPPLNTWTLHLKH